MTLQMYDSGAREAKESGRIGRNDVFGRGGAGAASFGLARCWTNRLQRGEGRPKFDAQRRVVRDQRGGFEGPEAHRGFCGRAIWERGVRATDPESSGGQGNRAKVRAAERSRRGAGKIFRARQKVAAFADEKRKMMRCGASMWRVPRRFAVRGVINDGSDQGDEARGAFRIPPTSTTSGTGARATSGSTPTATSAFFRTSAKTARST